MRLKRQRFDDRQVCLPGFEPDVWNPSEAQAMVPATITPISAAAVQVVAAVIQAPPVDVFDIGVLDEQPTLVRPWPEFLDDMTPPQSDVERVRQNIDILRMLRGTPAAALSNAQRTKAMTFSGWGSVARLFAGGHEGKRLESAYSELKSLLKENEWEQARASTPSAFYTSPGLASAMWAMAQRLGFSGGRVLDPSAGTGLFLATMPKELASVSEITAIEPELTSYEVLSKVFSPFGVRALNIGFESDRLREGTFDLVISNPPYGNYPVTDLRKVDFARWAIHNYFLARAIEVVRPGGLVIFVTSAHTLSANAPQREWLDQYAELVDAVKLPSGAFSRHAATEVETDILILRKRDVPAFGGKRSEWAKYPVEAPQDLHGSHPTATEHGIQRTVMVNPWFSAHPSRVLGRLNLENQGQHGGRLMTQCSPLPGLDLDAQLRAIASCMQEQVYKPRPLVPLESTPMSNRVVAALTELQPGSFVMHGGKLCISQGSTWLDVDDLYKGKLRLRVQGMLEIRTALRALLEYQRNHSEDHGLAPLQTALRARYEAFVAAHGHVSDSANIRAFRADPDCPLVLSLEHRDADTGDVARAAIFTQRTVNVTGLPDRVATVKDALMISLSEFGCVDMKDIARRARKTLKEVASELTSEGLAFKDPESHRWVPRDEYLSGHIRNKLAAARDAGRAYASNVSALEAALPTPLGPGQIVARLGAPWIPSGTIEAFIGETMALKQREVPTVSFAVESSTWSLSATTSRTVLDQQVRASTEWGTKSRGFYTLVEAALNQQPPTVTTMDASGKSVVDKVATIAAREKFEKIRTAFGQWVWKDDARAEQLVKLYNEQFNQLVPRQWDGSHLRLPGLSAVFKPFGHQLNAIWRSVVGGNTLLAHVVGAGKSLTMQASSMELRRLGLAKKPLHVVPNHMLVQYTTEFLQAYPAARLLMASADDLQGDKRREFVARVATGDWDGVVMTHATFERIPVHPDTMASFVDGALSSARIALNLAEDAGAKRSVKELEKRLKTLEAKLKREAHDERKDALVWFEDLGVDHLFVDEAHLFKSLLRISKMPRVAGLPNTSSMRAMDLFIKTGILRSHHGETERGVTLATATPVANSIAELHVFQRFLQPVSLRKLGLLDFDAWAATFGESVTGLEIAPDGSGFRINTRFSRFVNLPELMAIVRQVMDIQTASMLNLPRPKVRGGGPKTIVTPASDALKEFTEVLVKRAEAIRSGRVRPDEDNMLLITTQGRKAALDMRLITGGQTMEGPSKIFDVCREVLRIYRETDARKGTQLVFCDSGTPGSVPFSFYEALHHELVLAGIPAHEIAFIQDYGTDAKKAKLFTEVRLGVKRVLLGSTTMMGVGTNVQRLLRAVHQVDCPWRPCDITQRDGRAERMGNLWDEIELIRYVTKGSFDSYSWQTVETKARFVDQILSGDASIRSVEDVSITALTCAEIKALACGNPLVMEKAQVDAELAKLSLLELSWQRTSWNLRSELNSKERYVARITEGLPAVERDASQAAAAIATGAEFHPLAGDVRDAVMGVDDIVQSLGIAVRTASRIQAQAESPDRSTLLGMLGGFSLRLVREWQERRLMLALPESGMEHASEPIRVSQVEETGQLALAMLREIADLPMSLRTKCAAVARDIALLKSEQAAGFEHADRMRELAVRQAEIAAELDLDKDTAGTATEQNAEATAEAA